MLQINSSRIAPLFYFIFDMFLEKTKLKDGSSHDADWVHDLRFILIVGQKNYVLDAPLGDMPIAGANADVMNVWQTQYDDYLIFQCTMLYGLESGLQRRFLKHHEAYEIFQELKLVFQTHAHVERLKTFDKYFAYKMEENSSTSEHMLRLSG